MTRIGDQGQTMGAEPGDRFNGYKRHRQPERDKEDSPFPVTMGVSMVVVMSHCFYRTLPTLQCKLTWQKINCTRPSIKAREHSSSASPSGKRTRDASRN